MSMASGVCLSSTPKSSLRRRDVSVDLDVNSPSAGETPPRVKKRVNFALHPLSKGHNSDVSIKGNNSDVSIKGHNSDVSIKGHNSDVSVIGGSLKNSKTATRHDITSASEKQKDVKSGRLRKTDVDLHGKQTQTQTDIKIGDDVNNQSNSCSETVSDLSREVIISENSEHMDKSTQLDSDINILTENLSSEMTPEDDALNQTGDPSGDAPGALAPQVLGDSLETSLPRLSDEIGLQSRDDWLRPREKTTKKKVGQYLLGDVLGEGSYAKLRLATHLISKQQVSYLAYILV